MSINAAEAADYHYECRKDNNHVVHVITLHPKDYDLQLVKAHNQVFGRETLESIALRSNADVAINGGFFEIGQGKDGMSSGTLVIDGQLIGLRPQSHACLIQHNNQLSINTVTNDVNLKIGNKRIPLRQINQFSDKKDIVLYSSLWGPSTLTSFKDRKEIAFDSHHQLLATYDHGNAPIPQNGYVVSFPRSHPLEIKDLKDKPSLDFNDSLLANHKEVSAVMGIPQLIKDGEISEDLLQNKSQFYTTPQARTAVGLKPDGTIVVVVAEHTYKKPLTDITLGEVRTMLQNNKVKLSLKYLKPPNRLTMDELREIVKEEFTSPNSATGLTIPELANLMLDLGCSSAINLDGGGSSSLWIDGKIVNQTLGDKDEALGQSILRPLSDALIFKRKAL